VTHCDACDACSRPGRTGAVLGSTRVSRSSRLLRSRSPNDVDDRANQQHRCDDHRHVACSQIAHLDRLRQVRVGGRSLAGIYLRVPPGNRPIGGSTTVGVGLAVEGAEEAAPCASATPRNSPGCSAAALEPAMCSEFARSGRSHAACKTTKSRIVGTEGRTLTLLSYHAIAL